MLVHLSGVSVMAAICLSEMLEALLHQVGLIFACLVGGWVVCGGWTGVGVRECVQLVVVWFVSSYHGH